MKTRPAAVAGSFYPEAEQALRQALAELLDAASSRPATRPRGLIVPHAGYRYSGATAAEAYALLQPGAISRVILLGPAHRVYLRGIALPAAAAFATPLGEVPVDAELAARAAALPAVTVSEEAHALEHSLEVQLPFLQYLLSEFSLVPLLVGSAPAGEVGAVIDALWGGPETLIVVSSDLSHFEHYADASRHDATTCRRILDGDRDLAGTDACGAAPLNGLFSSRAGRQFQPELLAYSNSGDRGGDKSRVVGYAAFCLH